jgi:hypothetical protein
VAVSNEIHL